ncbi:MAG: class I SAM-dependent methyltransferase [Cyclobacteriaceae bacterium]
MTLREIFLQNPGFTFDRIFYQRDFTRGGPFEDHYLSLRQKEMRIYPDEVVKALPVVPKNHPLKYEWRVRSKSLERLTAHLRKDSDIKILDVGCGNGWLSHHLSSVSRSEVIGVDINEIELIQGARVFGETKNLFFVYMDILAGKMPYSHFDYIILSSSIQYFVNLPLLLQELRSLLRPEGEIHILDSPLYHPPEVPSAKQRSVQYFTDAGYPVMKEYYHHHTWEMLNYFQPKIKYNPGLFSNRFLNKLSPSSPFPWVVINASGSQEGLSQKDSAY